MNDNDEARKKKDAEKKLRAALRAKAAEVHPKGTEDDIKKKIEKKKKKGER